jgi:hypothetical protein
MGQTIKRYPVLEVAVLTQSHAPLASGHERAVEGDIIAARPPLAGIGMLEMHRHLWLRLDGIEEGEVSLTESVRDGQTAYEKRRYQIPLARLAQLVPGFDPDKARNTTEVYQPFCVTDEDSGLFATAEVPLDVRGLVFDTLTGEYL